MDGLRLPPLIEEALDSTGLCSWSVCVYVVWYAFPWRTFKFRAVWWETAWLVEQPVLTAAGEKRQMKKVIKTDVK